jgi:cyclopropane fatty-acyl-phospholipid synthase-like methyltransferase
MHNDKGVRKIINISYVYDFIQFLAGSSLAYKHIIKIMDNPGSILDIGCGTSEILKYIPEQIVYLGYDFNEGYITTAKNRYSDRKKTEFKTLKADVEVNFQKKFDCILVLGLLHHLTDDEVESVFETAQKHMDRNSVLITIDPIVHEKTSLAARYLISKDRGKAIRSTEQIFELATLRFSKIEFDLRNDLNNFPWSHVIMKASL